MRQSTFHSVAKSPSESFSLFPSILKIQRHLWQSNVFLVTVGSLLFSSSWTTVNFKKASGTSFLTYSMFSNEWKKSMCVWDNPTLTTNLLLRQSQIILILSGKYSKSMCFFSWQPSSWTDLFFEGLTFLHKLQIAHISFQDLSCFMVDFSSAPSSCLLPANFDRTVYSVKYHFANLSEVHKIQLSFLLTNSTLSNTIPFWHDVQDCGMMIG